MITHDELAAIESDIAHHVDIEITGNAYAKGVQIIADTVSAALEAVTRVANETGAALADLFDRAEMYPNYAGEYVINLPSVEVGHSRPADSAAAEMLGRLV